MQALSAGVKSVAKKPISLDDAGLRSGAPNAVTGQRLGTEHDPGLDFSSAMLRAEAGHQEAGLHGLVARLSSIPGLQLRVSYRHGMVRRLLGDLPYVNDLHRRTDAIREIAVDVGTGSYRLRSERGSLECTRTQGHTQTKLSLSTWVSALFEDIVEQNLGNHDSLVALRCLVEQDRVS